MRFDVSTSPITRLVPFVTTPNTSRGALWQGGNGFADDGTGADLLHERQRPEPRRRRCTQRHLGDLAGQCVRQDHRNHLDHRGADESELVPALERRRARQRRHRHRQLRPAAHSRHQPDPRRRQGRRCSICSTRTSWAASTPRATPSPCRAPSSPPGGQWIVGSPVFWNRGTRAPSTMYIWPGKTPLKQYAFDATAGKFTPPGAVRFKSTVNPPRRRCRAGTWRCRPTERPAAPASSGPPTACRAPAAAAARPGRALRLQRRQRHHRAVGFEHGDRRRPGQLRQVHRADGRQRQGLRLDVLERGRRLRPLRDVR